MSSEPSTQLKPTSAVAGGIAADLADPVSPLSTPDQGTGTAVLERPETEEQTDRSDNGDADRFAHYVSRDRIAESKLTGRPVVALCGKKVGASRRTSFPAEITKWSDEQLLAHLEPRIARYKWPKQFVRWTEMPKSGYGKIVKKNIRVLLEERKELA